ncbi:MAG: hypothetical protein ABIZ56_06495 [Chthoniobacteraceae bacterium]
MNSAPQPRVVIQNNTMRDAAVAIVAVVALLALLVFGIMQLREKPTGNALRGEIIEKVFTPMKEEIVEFSGRRMKSNRQSDGDYLFKVRVDSEGGRVFEVPVVKSIYVSKKVGDSMTFIRPESEQK